MFSSFLALMLAAVGGQATDTTRMAREAFTACLQAFVQQSVSARMTPSDFEAQYPQQCAAQEAAYREAIIRRDTAARIARAAAEESAGLEIEDARINFSERFAMAQPR
ncbi:MAG: hypothetical protein ACT4N8_03445 [Sphingosinicella sp.]|uniref:hypothetical protein n=1 Tax=Sphingosinicella sp. TaxID=1917971 RepID=UPI0040381D62